VPVEKVVADALISRGRGERVDLVSGELKLPRADVSEKLHSDRRYIVLKREVRKQPPIRSDKNCAPKIYAASISNRTQPAFIPMA